MDNLRVVLDTNILVSAFLSPKGQPAQILYKMRWRPTQGTFLRVYYNQEILNEYDEVLSRSRFKFEATPEERRFVLNVLKDNGILCNIAVSSVFPMKDESDRVFYDVAKAAGAFLITGNKKHYPDESFIVTPRDFIETVFN